MFISFYFTKTFFFAKKFYFTIIKRAYRTIMGNIKRNYSHNKLNLNKIFTSYQKILKMSIKKELGKK